MIENEWRVSIMLTAFAITLGEILMSTDAKQDADNADKLFSTSVLKYYYNS